MNDQVYNISINTLNPNSLYGYNFIPPTYQDVLSSLGGQVMEKFLFIGLFTIMPILWITFRDETKKSYIRDFLTGAAEMLILIAGLQSLAFWYMWKYGGL